MVSEQMALIQDVQSDEWWQDVTIPMLEILRRRLRNLIQLIDKRQRKPIYTDFEHLMGSEIDVALPGLAVGTDYAKFPAKARAFDPAPEPVALQSLDDGRNWRRPRPATRS